MTSVSHRTSCSDLDRISGRATCDQCNQFYIAKQMIRIQKSKSPHRLYEAIKQNSYYKSKQMGRVFYYVQSQMKIGPQSLTNRLKDVGDAVDFDLLAKLYDNTTAKSVSKSVFFPLLCPTSVSSQ